MDYREVRQLDYINGLYCKWMNEQIIVSCFINRLLEVLILVLVIAVSGYVSSSNWTSIHNLVLHSEYKTPFTGWQVTILVLLYKLSLKIKKKSFVTLSNWKKINVLRWRKNIRDLAGTRTHDHKHFSSLLSGALVHSAMESTLKVIGILKMYSCVFIMMFCACAICRFMDISILYRCFLDITFKIYNAKNNKGDY